jgi:hypothetical protein
MAGLSGAVGVNPDTIEHLRKRVIEWDADHVDGDDDLAYLANLMFELDLLVTDLRMYRSRIEQEFAKRCDTKVFEFKGGTAEVRGGSKRKNWDSPLLAGRVVTEAMEQGEHPQEAIVRCAGISYWRTGELKKLGIDANQYCETEHGLPRVIVRAKEQEGEK